MCTCMFEWKISLHVTNDKINVAMNESGYMWNLHSVVSQQQSLAIH